MSHYNITCTQKAGNSSCDQILVHQCARLEGVLLCRDKTNQSVDGCRRQGRPSHLDVDFQSFVCQTSDRYTMTVKGLEEIPEGC